MALFSVLCSARLDDAFFVGLAFVEVFVVAATGCGGDVQKVSSSSSSRGWPVFDDEPLVLSGGRGGGASWLTRRPTLQRFR